ncbi:hypothetical protein CR203_08385 [Salipaludibacillus neizhouensis]|uniref:Uncharacterized protein n=1 Tax=Salipaludibacillus neizhouensis TaxID=885475 RepID=A0A3A9K2J9_9BACI|nr:hypothetical protein [Salipaludibacillus neizhouensis]RKL67374.1 hypothetical protein CR203_08385 [Salipaludibacillus neizhouensis]
MIINLINKQTILLSSLLILFLLVGCSAGNNTQNNISSEDNTAESNEQNNTVNIEENNSEQLEEKEEELNDLQEEIKTKVAELQKVENELSNIEEEIEEKSNQLESGTEEDTNESANGNSDYEVIQEKADSVVIDLENEDFGTVAIHAHPEKGVQFSPYGYVDKNDHLTFTKEELRNFMEDSEEYNWGSEDGSGHPIELTPAEYYEEYIYIRDFSRSAS